MRVAILWKQMSGHARASFAALRDADVELQLTYRAATADAPYEDDQFDLGVPGRRWQDQPGDEELRADLDRFAPDALLVCSWDVGVYRRVARAMAGRTLRVLCMDNAWLGTAKQWGGLLVSPAVIRPTYDVAFLPGERQATFARKLGFSEDRILWGLYTCDHAAFAPPPDQGTEPPAAFVFAGRLVESKGADTLADGYRRYRAGAEAGPGAPWPLRICGTGPLAGRLAEVPGVELLGFVQPRDLPAVFARSGCLVLPSRFEPWGVVIHEAAAAGLAVVCSTACGAASRLVLDGYNGAVVPAGDAGLLAEALGRVARAGAADRAAMRRHSIELAGQFTPARWAEYLIERVEAHRARLGLAAR